MSGWDFKKYGKPFSPIQGSVCFRGYCPECGEPVRINAAKAETKKSIYCIDCNPPHMGCSSPPCKNDNEDEYSSSWKIATEMKD